MFLLVIYQASPKKNELRKFEIIKLRALAKALFRNNLLLIEPICVKKKVANEIRIKNWKGLTRMAYPYIKKQVKSEHMGKSEKNFTVL